MLVIPLCSISPFKEQKKEKAEKTICLKLFYNIEPVLRRKCVSVVYLYLQVIDRCGQVVL